MKTSKLVEKILSESQSARDSDKILIKKFLEANGIYLNSQQLETMMGINFESIRRVRQALQNTKGLYPASPEVAKQRRLKSYIIQQNEPQSSPERLGDLVEEQPETTWLTPKSVVEWGNRMAEINQDIMDKDKAIPHILENQPERVLKYDEVGNLLYEPGEIIRAEDYYAKPPKAIDWMQDE